MLLGGVVLATGALLTPAEASVFACGPACEGQLSCPYKGCPAVVDLCDVEQEVAASEAAASLFVLDRLGRCHDPDREGQSRDDEVQDHGVRGNDAGGTELNSGHPMLVEFVNRDAVDATLGLFRFVVGHGAFMAASPRRLRS